MDLTRSGSDTVLAKKAIHSVYEPSKDTPVALRSHINNQFGWMTGLSWREVLSQEESAVKWEASLLLYGCGSNEHPDANSTFR